MHRQFCLSEDSLMDAKNGLYAEMRNPEDGGFAEH